MSVLEWMWFDSVPVHTVGVRSEDTWGTVNKHTTNTVHSRYWRVFMINDTLLHKLLCVFKRCSNMKYSCCDVAWISFIVDSVISLWPWCVSPCEPPGFLSGQRTWDTHGTDRVSPPWILVCLSRSGFWQKLRLQNWHWYNLSSVWILTYRIRVFVREKHLPHQWHTL